MTVPQGHHVQAMAAFVALAAEGLAVSLHATPGDDGGDPVFEVRVEGSDAALGDVRSAMERAAEAHGGALYNVVVDRRLVIRWLRGGAMSGRSTPIAVMQSDEATFETYHTATGDVMLVMLPHGVERGDDRHVGWDLTWAEVAGLATLLNETLPDTDEASS